MICLIVGLCSTLFLQAQNGRENWFPNKGPVGIGTRTPSKDFEIIGDVNVTGTISSGAVSTATLQSGNLLNFNDAIIKGKVGIGGVSHPSEALDILGNLKLSGNITALGVNFQTLNANTGTFGTLTVNQNANVGGNLVVTKNLSSSGFTSTTISTQQVTTGLATFNDNATFGKNIILNGKLGIGVASPNELLEVKGNIKSNGLLTGTLSSGTASFSENVSMSKDLNVTGKLGVGVATPSESLDVNGNLKLTGSISASTLNVNQGNFPQGLSAGNTSVNGTLNVTNQVTSLSLSVGDISSTGNTSISKILSVTGQSQLNGGAAIGGTTTANDLQVNGAFNAKAISISDLNTTGNATVGQDINVTGKGQFGGDLAVTGQLTAQSISLTNFSATGAAAVGNGFSVAGLSELNGGATVNGDMSVSGALTVGSLSSTTLSITDLNTSGNASISQNMSVAGSGQVDGDLNVGGNFKAGVVTATDFKKADGSPLLNLDNTVVSQSLSVAADHVPDNYKMAVGGIIIATGIDIKIPQKWPDYVFTGGHKLLSIKEVNTFIKEHGHLPGVQSAQ